MSVTAETLRLLMEAGLAGEQLLAVVESIDRGSAKPSASPGAIRTRRYRERKAENVTSDVTVTRDSDAKVSPEPPSKEPPFTPLKGGVSPQVSEDLTRTAFNRWNDTAARCELPIAKDLTAARARAIKARLRDGGGLDGWSAALAAVESSKFLRGLTDRPFRADLDFVCQAKSFQRLVEGFYGSDANPPRPSGPPPEPTDPWPKRLSEFERNGFWNTTDWGPKPGKPGSLAPQLARAA